MGRWLTELQNAFFFDVPFLVDSAWRKFDFAINSHYTLEQNTWKRRPAYRTVPFLWLLITLGFVLYGPTFDSLCALTGRPWPVHLLHALLGLFFCGLAVWILGWRCRAAWQRIQEYLQGLMAARVGPVGWCRKVVTYGVPLSMLVVTALVLIVVAQHHFAYTWSPGLCDGVQLTTSMPFQALGQLGLFVGILGVAWAFASLIQRWNWSAYAWMCTQALLFFIAWGGLWWACAPREATEIAYQPYRHLFTMIAPVCMAIVVLAGCLARYLFASVTPQAQQQLRTVLAQAELFVTHTPPQITWVRIGQALFNGPAYHLLALALLPALLVLMAPDEWMWPLAIIGLVVAILLLTWGNLSTRWQIMMEHLRRWYLLGIPLVASIVVVLLAALRLYGNQYVATVIAAAPLGVLFVWVFMFYTLGWLFEHAINHALGTGLLALLGEKTTAQRGFIPYELSASPHPPLGSLERYLALHSIGRVAVVGHRSEKLQDTIFHTYSYYELLDHLASRAFAVGERLAPGSLAVAVQDTVKDVRRRIKFYFNIINLMLLSMVVVWWCYTVRADRWDASRPMVTIDVAQKFPSAITLTTLLAARGNGRALIVAASGGGSRAAAYTAAALQGLHTLGASNDLVLLSGVSGGGVALGYFAAHRQALLDNQAASWQRFQRTMAFPFVQDVLEGAQEIRIAGPEPLTRLLLESFDQQFRRPTTFGALAGIGLILNTTVSGHPAAQSPALQAFLHTYPPATPQPPAPPYTWLSGERLVFTNLSGDILNAGHEARHDLYLPFVVIQAPSVRLTEAAALNANFPPVFPNARVAVQENGTAHTSYYVTDGGASENLGLLSALYVLRDALQEALETASQPLPDIHIIALDASALDFDYSQDRGLGAALAWAKERIAGGLAHELFQDITTLHRALASKVRPAATLCLHYVPLPIIFRARGGIGTHWMLPDTIQVTRPGLAQPPTFLARLPSSVFARLPMRTHLPAMHTMFATDVEHITKDEWLTLLADIHAPEGLFCPGLETATGSSVERVRQWLCDSEGSNPTTHPSGHLVAWRQLTQALSSLPDPMNPNALVPAVCTGPVSQP